MGTEQRIVVSIGSRGVTPNEGVRDSKDSWTVTEKSSRVVDPSYPLPLGAEVDVRPLTFEIEP